MKVSLDLFAFLYFGIIQCWINLVCHALVEMLSSCDFDALLIFVGIFLIIVESLSAFQILDVDHIIQVMSL